MTRQEWAAIIAVIVVGFVVMIVMGTLMTAASGEFDYPTDNGLYVYVGH